MAFKGKNSSGIEYNLSALSTKLEYAPGKYYLTWDRKNLFVTGQEYEGTLYENQVKGTIYNTSLFGNDPWVTYTETDYWIEPYADVSAAWQLNLVNSSSFVNFKNLTWASAYHESTDYQPKYELDFPVDSPIYLIDGAIKDGKTYDATVLSNNYSAYSKTKNNLLILQGPGGTGGNGSVTGGGGSGGLLALVINPMYKPTNYNSPEYFKLMVTTTTTGGTGLHLYAGNSSWPATEILLAVAGAGGNGGNTGSAGKAGTNYINTSYENKAFWVLKNLTGKAGGSSSSNAGGSTASSFVSSTRTQSYLTEDCTYNRKQIGGYSDGGTLNSSCGAGAASWFADGGHGGGGNEEYAGDIGAPAYAEPGYAQGPGAGGGGAAQSGYAGDGGCAYVEIYHY